MSIICWIVILVTTILVTGSNASSSYKINSCRRGGQCECQLHHEWSVAREHEELGNMMSQVESLQRRVKRLDISVFQSTIHNVSQQMIAMEQLIQRSSLQLTVTDLTSMRKEVQILAALVAEVNKTGTAQESMSRIKSDLDKLVDALDELWDKNPGDNEMNAKVQELQNLLARCQDEYSFHNASFFPGDTLPIEQDYTEWCSSYRVKGIGEAVTHKWVPRWNYGAWYKDPHPKNEADRTKITYRSNGQNIYFNIWSNYADFITDKPAEKVNFGRMTGIGHVTYNGSIYFHHPPTIQKYDTATKQTTSSIALVISNINYREANTATYMDLKLDELGLWAVYTTKQNGDKLVVSKINPDTLQVEQTWLTNKRKSGACLSFMICGRLYALDTCKNRVPPEVHHEQFTFDTVTNEDAYLPIFLTSKYGHVLWATYNHRERLLFAWDNNHLVTYPILWEDRNTVFK